MADTRCDLVLGYLKSLHEDLCRTFASEDGGQAFTVDPWTRDAESRGLTGNGVTAVLEGGALLERAGVALSDVAGRNLPPAATARNPQLAGLGFRAMGVSVVMHPLNPHVPTSHMNVRFLTAGDVWWFGGGFDLTPYLVHEEDVTLWHRAAAQACVSFHPQLYAQLRRNCDDYFFLPHRGEARGVGGLFYDDLNADTATFGMPFERCFELMRSVATHYRESYLSIVRRRRYELHGERERLYQLYRRGRYVEFNLVHDRGTLFGLQSGGRVDSILMSMPPTVSWSYRSPDPGLDQALLPYLTTQRGRDWLTPDR